MNNNSQNSVVASTSQSKASTKAEKRKFRQESYRGKFASRPHMIIPQEDFLWATDQPNSVKTLFMECWMSDPYGSRPIQLNHSLKSSSFTAAKKIISDAGLFIFRSERSVRDGRESVCWKIVNLHGSRRNDFWLEQSNIEANDLADTNKSLANKTNDLANKASHLASISIETQSQQGFQNPSETSQEHLSNSSKELLEVLHPDPWADDRDQKLALEGQLSSASSPSKKKQEEVFDSVTQSNQSSKQATSDMRQSSKALNKKSTKVLEENYEFDWRSTQASERAARQNLAISREKATPEYETVFKDTLAQIQAKLKQRKEFMKADRESKSREDNPMTGAEQVALNEFKQEIASSFRPNEEDYDDSW